jgi:hypothetical protein
MPDLKPSQKPKLLIFRSKKRGPKVPLGKKGELKREWRKKRVAEGLCSDCPNKLDRIGILCSSCADKMKGAYRRRRKEMVRLGLCFICRKVPVSKSRDFMCPSCRFEHATYNREIREKLKQQVYAAYGNKCACCGELDSRFFTLDHVNGNGGKHRIELFGKNSSNQTALYRWIIRNGYPESLRIYCFNCNMGSYRNGGICPHRAIQVVADRKNG